MAHNENAFATYVAGNLERIDQCVMASVPRARSDEPRAGGPHADERRDDLNQFLFGPLARFVASGGKRIRPALCLLGAEAVGGRAQDACAVAAAVELFQAAALVHDDIADQSELRRGAPCLHVSEGTGLAINAGDAALVSATTAILRSPDILPATRLRLLDELCAMEERTLEGQALDLGWARDGRWDITVDDYLAMARRKTAYYSAAVPLAMGAICADGSDEQVEGLREYGMACGLAFQVQDDLLNLVGDASRQGKDYRSDITEGKRTLIMVWALSHLDGARQDELVRILSARTVDPATLARAVELAEESGALQHAQDYAHGLVQDAKDRLDHITIAQGPRSVLRSMADFFVERGN